MFYCEFREIFQNIFFTEHLRWLLLNIGLEWVNYIVNNEMVIMKWFLWVVERELKQGIYVAWFW